MSKLRFLVSLITKENDYQVEQAAAARAAASELGVDADIIYADNDPITQSTQVLKAVDRARAFGMKGCKRLHMNLDSLALLRFTLLRRSWGLE